MEPKQKTNAYNEPVPYPGHEFTEKQQLSKNTSTARLDLTGTAKYSTQ